MPGKLSNITFLVYRLTIFSCFSFKTCVACTRGRVPQASPSAVDSLRMARLLAPLLLLTAAARAVNISCQIFDETMVCDSEKESVHRGEIRTCSG